MKGKNILVTAACVIGFGGIIGNTLVGVATARELNNKIKAVEKNAQEADAAYNNSVMGELNDLKARTNGKIEEVQAAAQASLNAGLAQVSADLTALEASLKADYESADAAIRTQLINQLNTLVQQFTSAISTMSDDIAGLQAVGQTLTSKVATLEEDYEDLLDDVTTLKSTVNTISGTLSAVVNFVTNLDERLEAIEDTMAALPGYLAQNYATIASVNAYANSVNNALTNIASYFTVNGSIMTMNDVNTRLDDFDTALAEVNSHLSDIDDAIDEMKDVIEQTLFTVDDFDAFCGTEVTDLKAQLVQDLFEVITEYTEGVDDMYNAIYENYDQAGLVVPAAVDDIYASLTNPADIAAMQDGLMVAMTRIILAKDAEAAQKVFDEYAGDIEFDMDALRFELERSKAHLDVWGYYDNGGYNFFSFGYDQKNYFDANIAAIEFNNKTLPFEEKAQYYLDKIAELEFESTKCSEFDRLISELDAQLGTIDDFANDADRAAGTDVYEYGDEIYDVLGDYDRYFNALAETDEDDELVLNTAEKVAAFVNATIEQGEFLVFVADKLSDLYAAGFAAYDVIDALQPDLDNIDTDYYNTIDSAITGYIQQDSYDDAMNEARTVEDGEEFDMEAAKAAVLAYIEKQSNNCVYETRIATYLVDVFSAKDDADAEIDALTNLSDEQKAVAKAIYADDDTIVPTLTSLYEDTYKGVFTNEEDPTKVQFSTQEQFDAMYDAATANISAAVAIAEAQDGMIADEVSRLAILQAASEEVGLTSDIVDMKAQFDAFVEAALDNYTVLTDTGINGLDADGATLETVAVAAAEALAAQQVDTKLATDAYTKYIAVTKAADDLNAHIEARMAGYETNFRVTRELYNTIDTDAVWNNNADAIDNLVNGYTQQHGGADATLAEYVFGDAADYAGEVEALQAFYDNLEEELADIEELTAAFDAAAAQLELDMADEFAQLEATRLANEIAEQTANLIAVYNAVRAYIEANGNNSTLLAKADAYYLAAKDSIANADRSNEPKAIYDATYLSFANDVIGDKDIIDEDPESPTYGTVIGTKTGVEILNELMA